MALSIHQLDPEKGDNIFYESSMRRVFEDHLDYLAATDESRYIQIDPMQGHRHRGDFIGLLTELSVPRKYHWVTMRINGLIANEDYDGLGEYIVKANVTEIEKLATLHRTSFLKNRTN